MFATGTHEHVFTSAYQLAIQQYFSLPINQPARNCPMNRVEDDEARVKTGRGGDMPLGAPDQSEAKKHI
jgi:hypothetical protein